MTGRIGTRLGTGLLAVALAASVGAASAQDGGPGARHFERFSAHDAKTCYLASGLVQSVESGAEKARYLANFYAFSENEANKDIDYVVERSKLIFNALTRNQLILLGERCETALRDDDGPARFTLPYSDMIGERALAAYLGGGDSGQAAAAAEPQADYEVQARASAQAEAARLDSECRAIVDAGVEKATRNFRQAQSEVQVWIRAGSFGSPPGQYDIQNGCIAIDSAGSQLNAKQCPAEYANALMKFRAGYFIDFNGSGGFSCN